MKKLILGIFLLVLSIGGIKMYFLNVNKEVKPSSENEVAFKINYKNDICNSKIENIFEDENNIYYLACLESKNIILEFSNGKVYDLKEALNKKIVDIFEVINSGIDIKIKNKKDILVDEKFLDLKDNDVLLSNYAIKEANEIIKNKSNMLYDLNEYSNISVDVIKKLIELYKFPSYSIYNNNELLTNNEKDLIKDNRNIDNILPDNIKKALIIKRTNLRSFPTNVHFYKEKNSKFDNIQETEVLVNTMALVLHESKDKLWYFVLTPTYYGWVDKNNVALINDEDEKFWNTNNFIVITANKIIIDNKVLDMGVKLPIDSIDKNGYKVFIPSKDEAGNLIKTSVTISLKDAQNGYLPFTKSNFLEQAFKYLDTDYSWGGMDDGVDCSGYISNVLRTFGFLIPRNTSEQKKSIGEFTDLSNKSYLEKRKIIRENNLSLLYMPGHVMLYLKNNDNKDYIIHANASDMKVAVSELNDDKIKQIDRIVNLY